MLRSMAASPARLLKSAAAATPPRLRRGYCALAAGAAETSPLAAVGRAEGSHDWMSAPAARLAASTATGPRGRWAESVRLPVVIEESGPLSASGPANAPADAPPSRIEDVILPGTAAQSRQLPSGMAVTLVPECPPAQDGSDRSFELPGLDTEAPQEAPDGSSTGPLLCIRYTKRGQKQSQGLMERWWLEYDPPKANYLGGQGRGPFSGNSILKKDWPRQMIPTHYKKRLEKRERLRYAFRKHGVSLDIPKWGG
eukprot:TRINITY_DN51274_c0_g1_i1.p1 TRINITY_DN51274_c0_g1~~TRINITY_DN51274_c0_g1_i1.p1  ORF type:complete len:254 (-),score=38.86 TRINITY_DN51274_c0_g1_i1:42-803(-)